MKLSFSFPPSKNIRFPTMKMLDGNFLSVREDRRISRISPHRNDHTKRRTTNISVRWRSNLLYRCTLISPRQKMTWSIINSKVTIERSQLTRTDKNFASITRQLITFYSFWNSISLCYFCFPSSFLERQQVYFPDSLREGEVGWKTSLAYISGRPAWCPASVNLIQRSSKICILVICT